MKQIQVKRYPHQKKSILYEVDDNDCSTIRRVRREGI